MNKTKIDWCNRTLNPVKGCTNNCEYCYARKQNNRFHYVEDWNKPQFFPEVLEQLKTKTPYTIFIDSMSDIGCWKKEWFEPIFKAMAENPQHRYIALTKRNIVAVGNKYLKALKEYGNFYLYLGKSITTQEQADAFLKNGEVSDFLSVEPILEPINLTYILHYTAAVIIGAETGNRKDKVIPKKEWVQSIVDQCDMQEKTVFMKESLREIMGDDFRQDKLPWEIQK